MRTSKFHKIQKWIIRNELIGIEIAIKEKLYEIIKIKFLGLPLKEHLFNVMTLMSSTTLIKLVVGRCTPPWLNFQTLIPLFPYHLLELLLSHAFMSLAQCYQVIFLIVFKKLSWLVANLVLQIVDGCFLVSQWCLSGLKSRFWWLDEICH